MNEPVDPLRVNAHPGSIIFHQPESPPAIWGSGHDVLWAEGEALIVAGPQGVGKTSIAGQLLRARLGLQDSFLGFPVQSGARKTLYLAMDRPSQAIRSMRRQFRHDDENTLHERLVIWKGPPPADMALDDRSLISMARAHDADTVIVDSLKDAALGLTDDRVAAGYNRGRQHALSAGVQVLELHHQVKRGAGGGRPDTLADLYGSTWIPSGAGSVLLLWGEAGDPVVTMKHLKQPANTIGPLTLVHDSVTGATTVVADNDPLQMLRTAGERGVTAKYLAEVMFGKTERNEVEKARRRLDSLVRRGVAKKVQRDLGGGESGTAECVYAVLDAA